MFKNDEVFLLFAPWNLLRRFLLVTIILLIGTVYSGMTLLTQYFDTSPEWLLGILFSVGIMFCFFNFKVSQGSFLCAKILKYYALFESPRVHRRPVCLSQATLPDSFKLS